MDDAAVCSGLSRSCSVSIPQVRGMNAFQDLHDRVALPWSKCTPRSNPIWQTNQQGKNSLRISEQHR